MEKENSIAKFTEFFKDFIVITIISMGIYMIARLISLIFVTQYAIVDIDRALLIKIFSTSMLPIFFSYGIIIFVAYYLYKKTKKVMIALHEKEIQSEREEAILHTSQKVASSMVAYISAYNAEIQQWLNLRKEKNGNVPEKVEKASNKINDVLQKFTKMTYLMPYLKKNYNTIDKYNNLMDQDFVLERIKLPNN